jgi:hypothetical protein
VFLYTTSASFRGLYRRVLTLCRVIFSHLMYKSSELKGLRESLGISEQSRQSLRSENKVVCDINYSSAPVVRISSISRRQRVGGKQAIAYNKLIRHDSILHQKPNQTCAAVYTIAYYKVPKGLS